MIRGTMVLMAVAALAAGCGDEPQEIGRTPAKKADAQAWQATKGAYTADGWKPGDKDSWEAQMRTRAQGQNEYSRSAPAAPAVAAAAVAAASTSAQ